MDGRKGRSRAVTPVPALVLSALLAGLERPVWLGLGRYDFLVAPPSSWDRVRPHLRDLTVRVFERSGHTPQYEEAERFDAELLAWLAGPSRGGAARAGDALLR